MSKPVPVLTPSASRSVALAAHRGADPRRAAREALSVARLLPAQASAVDAIAATVAARQARPVAAPERPVLDRLHALANRRVEAPVLSAYRQCGYRVAGGAWAGGEHETSVCTVGPWAPERSVGASSDTSRAWSKNGKWRGMNSSHTLTVRPSWPERVQALGCAVVSSLLTLDADPVEVAPGIRRAVWVEQGRGTSLRTVHGFLVRRTDGSWMHADTERAARAALKSVAPRKPAPDVSSLGAAAILRRAKCPNTVEITLASAPVEGRICAAGVRDWAAKRGIDTSVPVTAGEVAVLAAASHDRVAEVIVVLRAAGMRARAASALPLAA